MVFILNSALILFGEIIQQTSQSHIPRLQEEAEGYNSLVRFISNRSRIFGDVAKQAPIKCHEAMAKIANRGEVLLDMILGQLASNPFCAYKVVWKPNMAYASLTINRSVDFCTTNVNQRLNEFISSYENIRPSDIELLEGALKELRLLTFEICIKIGKVTKCSMRLRSHIDKWCGYLSIDENVEVNARLEDSNRTFEDIIKELVICGTNSRVVVISCKLFEVLKTHHDLYIFVRHRYLSIVRHRIQVMKIYRMFVNTHESFRTTAEPINPEFLTEFIGNFLGSRGVRHMLAEIIRPLGVLSMESEVVHDILRSINSSNIFE